MKRRKITTAVLAKVVLACVIAWPFTTTGVVQATDENLATETTTTTTEGTESTTDDETTTLAATEEPRVGDLVWVSGEKTKYISSDKMLEANLSGKMKYEIYIIDDYDENYWRVNIPILNQPERVILMDKTYDIEVVSHDGYVVGDLCHDNKIDVFDLVLLRQALLDDFSDLDDYSDIDRLIEKSWVRALADVNNDQEVSVADVVAMQNFLLGRAKSFRQT